MMTMVIPSVPNLPVFFAFFLLIYLIAYYLIFPNWSPKIRPEAASCIISLFHGTPAVFVALHAILSSPNPNPNDGAFSARNTPLQSSVLDYSIAYFLTDLLHYLLFFPSDLLFIGHHLATLFVFLTCRYLVSHGAYAILSLLILAEVTSAFQNVWTLARARRHDVGFAAKLHDYLCLPFYTLYSVVRGFLGPYFVYKMALFYASGAADEVIPRWVWVSWILVVVTAISVSILWVSNLWVELYRERSGKLEKKLR